MNAFSRSWAITKSTFRIMSEDKSMLLFPFIASIFSVLVFIAFVVPYVVTDIFVAAGATSEILSYVLLFLFYLGIVFVATFANVGVVYIAKNAFEGKKTSFGEAFGFAMSRLYQIFLWSVVSAVVGVLLSLLERFARSRGGMGGIMLSVLRSLAGMAWSIVSLFVVPAIVYEGVGPFDALKQSASTLKKTWGESLIRHFGLGFMHFISNVIGIVVGIGLLFLLAALAAPGIVYIILICLLFIYFILVNYVFSVANAIFNAALYHYAKTNTVPKAFSQADLPNTFSTQR